jgi:hypothetical protein
MTDEKPTSSADEFNAHAAGKRTTLVGEFVDFLKHNKKWWLTPILLVILLVGLLVVLTATGAGPFIYALF